MAKKWKPTKTWAKKAKRAIQETIDNYKTYGLRNGFCASHETCPLCLFDDTYDDDCFRCPWVVFRGKNCRMFEYTKLSNRLRRLRGWVKRCDNIINKEAS